MTHPPQQDIENFAVHHNRLLFGPELRTAGGRIVEVEDKIGVAIRDRVAVGVGQYALVTMVWGTWP